MTERMEGSGASQLVQLIRILAYNTEVSFELATVLADPPDLKIQIDHMAVPLEKDDLVVAESLTKHQKKMKLTSKKTTVKKDSPAPIGKTDEYPGDNQMPPHPHGMTSASFRDASFTIEEGMIEYQHELKQNDRVLVACNQNQSYFVLARLVAY
ncbi:DUF2577 family protein [Ectobacillus ponti]|uniref:DUF2577 domain-containing protein n=1 Tax=Ectobacillus ponti TaxID=2961894 RepID=A0AA42BQM7_9BACI|nr:DUF2577 family protein [Ectobacillus ponti]MCP8970047.1 DUF2577 domain-containing protein [Ectobacillus ponti]